MIKRFIRFFKIVPPRGTTFYSNDSIVKGSVYLDRFISKVITNSFKTSVIQKFENIFFLPIFCCTEFVLFLDATTKFMMVKGVQKVYSFHANAYIKVKFTFSISVFANENIYDRKTNKNCP